MAKFEIYNTLSGVALGTYEGATEEEALDAMARDAGYKDYSEALEVAPVTGAEIFVKKIDNA